MISPWTKPGTKVVVIETTGRLPKLVPGSIVEVERMVECDQAYSNSFGEILVAIKGVDHSRSYPSLYYRWWRRNKKFAALFYCREFFNELVEDQKPEALPAVITALLSDPTKKIEEKV